MQHFPPNWELSNGRSELSTNRHHAAAREKTELITPRLQIAAGGWRDWATKWASELGKLSHLGSAVSAQVKAASPPPSCCVRPPPPLPFQEISAPRLDPLSQPSTEGLDGS